MIEQLYWIVHKDCEYLISLKLDIRDIGLNFVHIKIRKKKISGSNNWSIMYFLKIKNKLQLLRIWIVVIK